MEHLCLFQSTVVQVSEYFLLWPGELNRSFRPVYDTRQNFGGLHVWGKLLQFLVFSGHSNEGVPQARIDAQFAFQAEIKSELCVTLSHTFFLLYWSKALEKLATVGPQRTKPC